MRKEIKAKLEEIVALLNDPEEVVLEKEISEKLQKIVLTLSKPRNLLAEKETQEKLDRTIVLVNNAMVDPDIDIDYFAEAADDPHILVTYVVSEYTNLHVKSV